MFIRFSVLFPVAALIAFVTAAPGALEARQGQCNTGPIQCCDNTYTQTHPTLTTLLGTLWVALPSVSGFVGLGCTSVTGIGARTGSDCTQQPVCCTGNTYNGFISLGCSSIDVNA